MTRKPVIPLIAADCMISALSLCSRNSHSGYRISIVAARLPEPFLNVRRLYIAGAKFTQAVTRTSGDNAKDGTGIHAAVTRLLAVFKLVYRDNTYHMYGE